VSWLIDGAVESMNDGESYINFQTLLIIVRAMDGDRGVNNRISYSLLNENDLFGIDSESGIVFTKGTLDREDEHSGGSYILQLLVRNVSVARPCAFLL